MAWSNKLHLPSPVATLEPATVRPITLSDLLNGKQAAAFLDTSYPRFLLAVRMGHLPQGVLIGGRRQWSKAMLASYIDSLFRAQENPR